MLENQSKIGVLATPAPTPLEEDDASPEVQTMLQQLLQSVQNLQIAFIHEQTRRSKIYCDFQDKIASVTASVEYLTSTAKKLESSSSSAVSSSTTPLLEATWEVEQNPISLQVDKEATAKARAFKPRDKRGLFIKKSKETDLSPATSDQVSCTRKTLDIGKTHELPQHQDVTSPHDNTQAPNDQPSHVQESALDLTMPNSNDMSEKVTQTPASAQAHEYPPNRQDSQHQNLQHPSSQLQDPLQPPVLSTRAANHRSASSKPPTDLQKDDVTSTPAPTRKHDKNRKEKKATGATATQPRDAGKQSKIYSNEELQYIGANLQRLFSETALSREEAAEKVSQDMKALGYDRTPGAVMLQWYIKLAHDYATAKFTDAQPIREKTMRKQTSTRPSSELNQKATSGYEDTPVEMTTEIAPNHKKQAALQTRSSNANLLLKTRLGYSATSSRSTRKPVTELARSSACHFVTSQAWTGASNDILDVAWSSDGTEYVCGSAAMAHPYNRGNNLLYGNIVHNQLKSLPGHRERNFGEISQLLDPWTYYTVSFVSWKGDRFYTAGFNNRVEIWDPTNPDQSLLSLPHSAPVEAMALSGPTVDLLATATNSGQRCLRLYPNIVAGGRGQNIPLSAVRNQASFHYSPTCIKFGLNHHHANELLAGFGSSAVLDDGSPSPRGLLALWRFDDARATQMPLDLHGQQVFDVAWATRSSMFLSGNTIGKRRNGVNGSIVRIYDRGQLSKVMEANCPAVDMNEVSFCPFDERIFSASCTNRSTYLWDIRNVTKPFHVLEHDFNVCGRYSELDDTGVKVIQWGNERSELFTGSSDGILRQWDIRRAPDDVLIDRVVNSGIELMSGKLSPDKSAFLLGDASGSLRILTRSPLREEAEDIGGVNFEYSHTQDMAHQATTERDVSGHEGKEAAQELVDSGQIVIDEKFGPGQGPNYAGPYATWARRAVQPDEDIKEIPLLWKYRKLQRGRTEIDSRAGVKRKNSGTARTQFEGPVGRPLKLRMINSGAAISAAMSEQKSSSTDRRSRSPCISTSTYGGPWSESPSSRSLSISGSPGFENSPPSLTTEPIQQMLATRAAGSHATEVLRDIATGTGTSEQLAEFQAVMDGLKNSLRKNGNGEEIEHVESDQESRGTSSSETTVIPKRLETAPGEDDSIEIRSDSGEAVESQSDSDDDDGYVPPHWMVDANIEKKISD